MYLLFPIIDGLTVLINIIQKNDLLTNLMPRKTSRKKPRSSFLSSARILPPIQPTVVILSSKERALNLMSNISTISSVDVSEKNGKIKILRGLFMTICTVIIYEGYMMDDYDMMFWPFVCMSIVFIFTAMADI